MKRTITVLFAAALVAGACSANTSVPQVVEQPTPVERVVEVEVTPQACIDLVQILVADASSSNDVLIDLFDAYLDYPSEDLADFGRRAEKILADADLVELPPNFLDLMDECVGATSTGLES